MSEVHLDLEKQVMRVDDRRYFFQGNSDYDSDHDSEDGLAKFNWYKESEKYVTADPEDFHAKRFPIEDAKHVDPPGGEWSPARVRVKDRSKLKELAQAFNKAEPEAKANRQELNDVKEWLENNQEARKGSGGPLLVERLSSSGSDSDTDIFDWEVVCHGRRYVHKTSKKLKYGWWKIDGRNPKSIAKHSRINKALRDAVVERIKDLKSNHSDKVRHSASSEEPTHSIEEKTDVPKRTKWGTRIWSNDKKHYFGVGVWKSTKYEGCTTVRLTVAGKTCMYTLDEIQIKALRNEVSRGVHT